jgi:hypothetical protein
MTSDSLLEHMLVVGLAPDSLEERRFNPPLDAFETHEDDSLNNNRTEKVNKMGA